MSWSEVPEADRLEQAQDVRRGEDPEEEDPMAREMPLEAPPEDVVEQRTSVPVDDEDDWRG